MNKIGLIFSICVIALWMSGCGAPIKPISFPKIDRSPAAANCQQTSMTSFPRYDPNSTDPWQVDLRTTASPCGKNEYAFYRTGGWSWSIPYIAGVYALGAQAKPTITPDEFWSEAMKSGQTITQTAANNTCQLGPILNSQALITALRSK